MFVPKDSLPYIFGVEWKTLKVILDPVLPQVPSTFLNQLKINDVFLSFSQKEQLRDCYVDPIFLILQNVCSTEKIRFLMFLES